MTPISITPDKFLRGIGCARAYNTESLVLAIATLNRSFNIWTVQLNLIKSWTREVHCLTFNEFLKPTAPKVIITLLIPILVDVIMTSSTAFILDFYWYLLTPIITAYIDGQMRNQLNSYILLWIPFYLTACLIDTLYKKVI